MCGRMGERWKSSVAGMYGEASLLGCFFLKRLMRFLCLPSPLPPPYSDEDLLSLLKKEEEEGAFVGLPEVLSEVSDPVGEKWD